MTVFDDIADLQAAAGQHLGYNDWPTVTHEATHKPTLPAIVPEGHRWLKQ